MDCSLPGSSIHGIFQARILEWVAISFSNTSRTMIKSQFSFGNLKSREGDVFIIEHRSPALQVDSLSSAPGKLIRYLDSLIHSLAYHTIIT